MGATRGRGSGRRFVLLVIVLVSGAAKFAAAQQVQVSPSGLGPNYFDLNDSNSSTVIAIVILVTAFFFIGLCSIYIRRCAGGQLGGPGDYPGSGRPGGDTFASGASRSRRVRGLDPAVLETFPIMAYADVKLHKAGKGALECAVCLSEFDDDDTLRLLPKCSHAFHTDCIDAWLASHVTCPVCRENLVPDAEAATAVRTAVSTTTEQDVPAPEQPAQEAAAAPEQVAVVVIDAEETEEERIRREEAAELMRIGSVKRALRNKSGRRPAQFPRSHTTGHSLSGAPLAAAGESVERFTLRLPEHVLREVVAAGKLRRTTSLQAFRTGGDGSTRRGFGGARSARSVRLGQSGRWPNMSFLERPFTERLPAWGSVRRGEADAPVKVAGDGKAAEQQRDGGACPLPLGGRV